MAARLRLLLSCQKTVRYGSIQSGVLEIGCTVEHISLGLATLATIGIGLASTTAPTLPVHLRGLGALVRAISARQAGGMCIDHGTRTHVGQCHAAILWRWHWQQHARWMGR